MAFSFEWRGIFPALTTPFTANDELDPDLFVKNLKAQWDAGVHGVILGGTLGEASVLTTGEKELLVQAALEHSAGRPVILNVAEGSTRVAIEQVKLAARWGVQGLMLLPPMRYKPDHREAVHYFRTIADHTDLPVLLYNNPVDYKTEITISMFEELQNAANITAVKESTRDVTNVTRMRNAFGDRYKILCGVDTLAMEELVLGADGWVAGLVCAFPKQTVQLYQLVLEGRLDQARSLYRWFMPLLELDIHPKLVQYIKLASAETGIGSEYVRAPRLTLEGEERERVLRVIRRSIQEFADFKN